MSLPKAGNDRQSDRKTQTEPQAPSETRRRLRRTRHRIARESVAASHHLPARDTVSQESPGIFRSSRPLGRKCTRPPKYQSRQALPSTLQSAHHRKACGTADRDTPLQIVSFRKSPFLPSWHLLPHSYRTSNNSLSTERRGA